MKVILTCILRTEIIIDYEQPGAPVWEGRDNTLEADIEAAMCFGKNPIVHLKEIGYETDVRRFDVEVIEKNVCRECGCTDDDCHDCIERTGEPCTWVEPDLCSACSDIEGSAEDGDDRFQPDDFDILEEQCWANSPTPYDP